MGVSFIIFVFTSVLSENFLFFPTCKKIISCESEAKMVKYSTVSDFKKEFPIRMGYVFLSCKLYRIIEEMHTELKLI